MQFNTTAVVLAILALCAPALANPTHQFDQFFPAWNKLLQGIIHQNCSQELATYETGTPDPSQPLSSLVDPLIECILEQFPQFRMSEMASSAVILGLLPTILQSLGSMTAETSLLSLRRPVLAFLLAAGSPAVATMKGSQFVEEISKFVEGGDTRDLVMPGLKFSRIPKQLRPFVSIFEYLVILGAVANVVDMAYRLGVNAVVIFSPETIFMVPLWTFLAVAIHCGGVAALHMRVRVRRVQTLERKASGFSRHVPDELVPSAFQPPKRLEWREENVLFHAWAWFLGVGTVLHTVFGTLVLSSLLFFSVVDSIIIVGRYCLGTIVCRAVLRFELAGMSQATKYQSREDRPEEEFELTRHATKQVGAGHYQSQEIREE